MNLDSRVTIVKCALRSHLRCPNYKRIRFDLQFVKFFTNWSFVRDQAQEIFYKTLGARIRELRGAKLSQEQLATAAKLSRTSIVNIESGRQKLLLHNLFRIAEALGVQPSEVLHPLEPARGEVPRIEISGGASNGVKQWVQRSVDKARKTQLPQ